MSHSRLCFFSHRLLLLLSLSLSTGLTNQAQAADICKALSTPYTATYFGSYKGWRIDVEQKLEKTVAQTPDGNSAWRLTILVDNFLGAIHEQTDFWVSPLGNLVSHEYNYKRSVFVNRFEQQQVFDWKARVAKTTGDKSGQAALQGGEYDNLNYQVMLRCELQQGKKDFRYRVVDRSKIDPLDYTIIGEEKLDTRLGELNTVVVKRIRENKNRVTTIWFAKDMDYLMVKLLQEEKKDTEAYLLYIDRVEPLPHR